MFVRAICELIAATIVLGGTVPPGETAMSTTLYLVPFGKTDPKTVQELQLPLESRLRLQVRVEKSQPLPVSAFNAGRGQYLSTAFLEALSKHYRDGAAKALGVADVDLYVPRLNFVFGEAEKPGRFAVISLTRLRPEYYGAPEDKQVFTQRMVKEAVHELGHTFGLGHCTNPECVMFFSNSLKDTDRKRADFCEPCAARSPYVRGAGERAG